MMLGLLKIIANTYWICAMCQACYVLYIYDSFSSSNNLTRQTLLWVLKSRHKELAQVHAGSQWRACVWSQTPRPSVLPFLSIRRGGKSVVVSGKISPHNKRAAQWESPIVSFRPSLACSGVKEPWQPSCIHDAISLRTKSEKLMTVEWRL